MLLGFALDREIGVDVERTPDGLDFARLSETAFSQTERNAVLAPLTGERANLFYGRARKLVSRQMDGDCRSRSTNSASSHPRQVPNGEKLLWQVRESLRRECAFAFLIRFLGMRLPWLRPELGGM